MKNNNVFIIDFETTGLKIYNKVDFPIEIGIIICDINSLLSFKIIIV